MSDDIFIRVPSVSSDGTRTSLLLNMRHVVAATPLLDGGVNRTRVILANSNVDYADVTDSVDDLCIRISNAQDWIRKQTS